MRINPQDLPDAEGSSVGNTVNQNEQQIEASIRCNGKEATEKLVRRKLE